MELFLFASGVGVLILLAVLLLDYAVESTRQSVCDPRVSRLDEEVPAGDRPFQLNTVPQYDQAA
jgi:hypothetical protein